MNRKSWNLTPKNDCKYYLKNHTCFLTDIDECQCENTICTLKNENNIIDNNILMKFKIDFQNFDHSLSVYGCPFEDYKVPTYYEECGHIWRFLKYKTKMKILLKYSNKSWMKKFKFYFFSFQIKK